VLYKDRFQAISRLSEKVVFEDSFQSPKYAQSKDGARILGVTRDAMKNTFWIYSPTSVYEVVIQTEDRDVWELYLQKQEFSMAFERAKDAAQRDKVLTCQAEHHFNKDQFELAAQLYARTERSFEEVALRFLNKGERDALKTYLLRKIENTPSQDMTQLIIM
jgi:hypothetical protein